MGKSGPLERAQLANQIQGLRIPDRSDAGENNKYMLFAGGEGRIVKNSDRGLENAARGRRPRAAFSSPRSQFFTIRTHP